VEQLGGQAVVAEQVSSSARTRSLVPTPSPPHGACRATAGAEVGQPGGTALAELEADLTPPVVVTRVAGVDEAVADGAVGGPGRVAVSSTAKSTAVCSP
jgi:hypothetical protein